MQAKNPVLVCSPSETTFQPRRTLPRCHVRDGPAFGLGEFRRIDRMPLRGRLHRVKQSRWPGQAADVRGPAAIGAVLHDRFLPATARARLGKVDDESLARLAAVTEATGGSSAALMAAAARVSSAMRSALIAAAVLTPAAAAPMTCAMTSARLPATRTPGTAVAPPGSAGT